MKIGIDHKWVRFSGITLNIPLVEYEPDHNDGMLYLMLHISCNYQFCIARVSLHIP